MDKWVEKILMGTGKWIKECLERMAMANTYNEYAPLDLYLPLGLLITYWYNLNDDTRIDEKYKVFRYNKWHLTFVLNRFTISW